MMQETKQNVHAVGVDSQARGAGMSSTDAPAPGAGTLDRVLPILIVLAGFGALAGMTMMPKHDKQAAAVQPAPIPVKVRVLQPLPVLQDSFSIPGVVEPNRVVKVAGEVAGRIERLAVQEGDVLRKNQPMVYLNTDLLAAQYQRAKAQADFDANEAGRVKQLSDRGVATNNELDVQQTKLAVSKAAMDEVKAQLDRAVILSPIDGVLEKMPVQVGEYIQPGNCACQIVDMDTAKVVVDVPERDVHYLGVGQEQTILVQNGQERKLAGKITYISELADLQTRTTRVEISIDNRRQADNQRPLRSGQIVKVEVVRQALKDVALVPLEAVMPLESGKEVFVVQTTPLGDVAKSVRVELGLFRGNEVQILGGAIKAGQRVIISGHRFIRDGQAVAVQESEARP